MVDFKELIISSILVGLFLFAMISFGSQFAVDNNLNDSIAQVNIINESYGDMQTQLAGYRSFAQDQKKSLFEGIAILQEVGVIVESVGEVVKAFGSTFLYGTYNVTFGLIKKALGIDSPIIEGVFWTIIIFTSSLLIWRVIKTGS